MRSFTILKIQRTGDKRVNYIGGRFLSETPAASASKMFTKAYHHLNAKGPMSMKITLRETSQGSNKKEYVYRITRKSDLVEVERDGVLVTYKFSTKVKSLN
jgi:hypothetical protein